MNRRDFFKLGAGGMGAVVGGTLASDLERSVTFSKTNGHGHPWWVKTIDKPKLAVDDSVYSRFEPRKAVFGSLIKYYGMENAKALRRRSQEKKQQYFKEKRPGYRLDDRALADAG